jgi:uncharacterized protein YggU (UPF0235/DUF167 family)
VTRPPKPAATSLGDARFLVLVTPRASTNTIDALHDGSVRVRVTAAPADGAANRALIRLLADSLGIAPGRHSIVAGASARRKVVQVREIRPDDVASRLRKIDPQASVASRRRTAGRIPPAR